jgi:type I restriction enzyme S subunit
MSDTLSTSWSPIKLGDVARIQGGFAFRSSDFCEDGIPIIRMSDLKSGHLDLRYSAKVPSRVAAALDEFRLRTGDVLVGMSGSLTNYAIVSEKDLPAYLNQRVGRLHLECSDRCDYGFVTYVVLSPVYAHHVDIEAAGAAQRNVSGKQIEGLSFHLPPLPEQRKIARILMTVDNLIEQTEALIEKQKSIKQGMMHDLFTRGVDSTGQLRPPYEDAPHLYKESPLGWIPKEWEAIPLNECTSSVITYGIVQAGPHIDGGIPYIRTGDMSGDRLERDGMLCTSKRIAQSFKRSEVQEGEIVCAIRATVGKVLEIPIELDGANLTQGTARISPRATVNNQYLLWAIRSHAVQGEIQLSIKGTTFAEITLANLREINVPLPKDRKEQDRIAEALICADHRLDEEKEFVVHLRQIKGGLMQDLLTGKVRVNVDKAEEVTTDV